MARSAQRALEISGCEIIDINMGCPAPKIVNNGDGSALMKSPDLAARIVEAVKKAALEISGCEIIDINMGCPAPKIVNNGDGSALMKSPDLAARIVEAVKKAVPVPVTVKFRMGWDANSINCVEFARMCEQSGADMIAVHGRTRSQQYSGQANWDIIRTVKQVVSIPVTANGDVFTPEDVPRILAHTGADFVMIGRGSLGDPWIFERAQVVSIPVTANGDVFTPEDVPRILAHTGADFVMIGRGSLGDPWIFERANALLQHTGADFVMIGRGSLGDPWIFERANALLQTGELPPLPPFAERIDTAVRQIELAARDKGEHIALLEARKHVNWYLKGVSHVRDFKKRISALEKLSELHALAEEMKAQITD